ncbi:CDP-diacylglycerol--glycerol-3-phosphate 3-phosphatidyltransferase [Candidatus Schneideria nysicola]|uniref:CDP-diacylglycerol--glycerol-3-phosphate 3-phosphatidyltransferase n=1 Tax=Candidatus Schneideria nysicola TaxID=1081631 RepID=UPI001CAA7DB1|nr:CDP-diacylglycerol--glycerol-3-phosphate 3-phosphatidyltransferase [Candidatus Schneideria nysicola]UAJ64791.1 CDP-diacylglycerol--glycerol-3-phosphate 3-phosphatidyltransferase [Candidatus Schneideria nysicola]UAJ65324.1 CDP-diacylglycerol--glycerol-3-phosphate 3-phosphatidyltransferase [Candidatus Schneideria nysicola]
MYLNIPIWLTLIRIVMIPFFVLAFYLPVEWSSIACVLLFGIAAITDWFDGFLARRWKQITRFGTFLDPVADKIMMAMAFTLVIEEFHSWWITLPSTFMIAREIIISALREWMAEIGKRDNISVSCIGKIKTSIQMFSAIALLYRSEKYIILIGTITLYIAALLALWSMWNYFHAVWIFYIKR